MKRKLALESLVQLKQSITQVLSELESFDWDCQQELVRLEPEHVQNVLQLYLQKTVSAQEVETWANAIEGREDINIESLLVNEALHELANPLLTQLISEGRAYFWISRLSDIKTDSNVHK